MSFCILIPTINRKDLLVEALKFYSTKMPNTQVLIWDNGNQKIPEYPNTTVTVAPYNYGVAPSWNALIDQAIERGFENFLILNDDVVVTSGEGVINIIIENGKAENAFHRCRSFYNWSSFILRKSIFEKVGRFDENFQRCFFEDNDYEYRMRLAGVRIRIEDGLNPQIYKNSQSTQKDPRLSNFINNRDYFVKKWGGMPTKETYKTPFNK